MTFLSVGGYFDALMKEEGGTERIHRRDERLHKSEKTGEVKKRNSDTVATKRQVDEGLLARQRAAEVIEMWPLL